MNSSPARSKLLAVTVALLTAVAILSGCIISVDPPFVADPSGCFHTSDSGTSSNPGMQELARGLYTSLTCNGDVPVEQQLITGANDPAFRKRAADVGATIDIVEDGSTIGSTKFTAEVWLWDERNPEGVTVCTILIMASPHGKTLMCEIVASGSDPAPSDPDPAPVVDDQDVV